MKRSQGALQFAMLAMLVVGMGPGIGWAEESDDPQVNAQQAAVNALTTQFVQQLRPTLQSELEFIRFTCDLKPAQRKKIKTAGEAGLQSTAKKLAEKAGGQRHGIVVFLGGAVVGGRSEPAPDDPSESIRAALSTALKKELTQQQMKIYTELQAGRTAARKRAALLSVVARLDTVLLLSAEQRDQIMQDLSSKWQVEWESWLALRNYDAQYCPSKIDHIVTPRLNEAQKAIWQNAQKIDLSRSFGWEANGLGIQLPADDGWWDGTGAKPGAAKKK